MTTALLLLAGDPEVIRTALGELHPDDAVHRWAGIRAPDDPMANTVYGSRWPYGGFVALEYPDTEPPGLGERLSTLVGSLGEAIDPSRSAVLVGTTHRIIDGRTDVALVYLIHRIGGLTVEQYQDHWLNQHGPLAKALVPTSGYEQTHADHDGGAALASRLGFATPDFDGNATCFFDTAQDFADMLTARESSRDMNVIYEDELRFLDHDRSLGALMRQVPLGAAP
ncbi:MAG TPA: EthD domain-containing protein [Ilumatobacteraceae bacterium]|nr:EthD domain-containing protein [Ilumatobacteraceae bacterium]